MVVVKRYDVEPPLSEEQKRQLRALDALSDENIDLSDIPEMTDKDFAKAEQGRFYSPRSGHLAIDPDILDWLGGHDLHAVRRANAILRDAMEREQRTEAPDEAAE